MINADMRTYYYFTLGTLDEYGQLVESTEPTGTIKMAINLANQSIQDNINYKDAEYVGLTMKAVDDSYIIQFGNQKLKVLYVNSFGRYKQVYMKAV